MNYQLGYLGVPLGETQATEKPLNICQWLGATHCETDGQGDVSSWHRLAELLRAATQPNCLKPEQDQVQTSHGLDSDLEEERGSLISVRGYGYQCYHSRFSLD